MRDDDKVPREGEIAIEHVAKELWQIVDKLGRLPSPRPAHCFKDSNLRDPPEIVLDGRAPACLHNIKRHRAREAVGLHDAPINATVSLLVERVDSVGLAHRPAKAVGVAIRKVAALLPMRKSIPVVLIS